MVAVAALPVVFWLRVGKSAAMAILGTPVPVVFLRIPVAKPAREVPLILTTVVAFPTEVASPVKFGMVVTLPAVSPAAVPVIFVPTRVDGVPRLGVTKVGELEKTKLPVPVAPVEVTPSTVWCPVKVLPASVLAKVAEVVGKVMVVPSVPAKVREFDRVKVLEVVPPAIWKPIALACKVSPFTEVGVMAPNPIVKAGVVVAVAQVAVTPLLAAAVDTEVTVPVEAFVQEGARVVPLLCSTCPAVPLARNAVVFAADW